jgi:hypothetical protein
MKLIGDDCIEADIYIDNDDHHYNVNFGKDYNLMVPSEKQKFFDDFVMYIGNMICPWNFYSHFKQNPFCPKERYFEFHQNAHKLANELDISFHYLDMATFIIEDLVFINFNDYKPELYPPKIREFVERLIDMR